MEITIKINGQAVFVEVSYEVYEYLCESNRKAENLSHQKRRHWDEREFDEYIVATECSHIYSPTPEEILCHRETMCELMAVLASCTEVQQERFLLYALEGMSFSEIEASSIQDAQQSALVSDAISLAENLAITTVTAIEQTTAATLRQAVKDGKGTPAQMKQLAYDAAIQLQDKLNPIYLDALQQVYGDVNGYLVDLIEQKVWELKNLPTALVEV